MVQVTLIENDNVIETLAPDQTNDPLAPMIIDQGEVVHESSAQELLAGVVGRQRNSGTILRCLIWFGSSGCAAEGLLPGAKRKTSDAPIIP